MCLLFTSWLDKMQSINSVYKFRYSKTRTITTVNDTELFWKILDEGNSGTKHLIKVAENCGRKFFKLWVLS